MKPIIVAVWNDKHTNSTVGLCPPQYRLDDQWSATVSKYQMWLWQSWLDYISQVKRFARGCSVVGIENGDGVDIDAKGRSTQYITQNHVDAIEMAHEANKPLLNLCDRFWLTRGTGAHEGKDSQYAVALAEKCNAEWYEGTQAPQVLRLLIGGVYLEVTHHAVGGFRKAPASARSAAQLAEDTIIEYTDAGERVPDLVLRGHVHRFADSYDAYERCRAITNGAWQLHTSHSHRAGYGTKRSHIGGLIIKIEKGEYEVKRCQYTWKQSAPVVYNGERD